MFAVFATWKQKCGQ